MDEKQLQLLFNEYGKSNGFADYNEFKSLMANPSSRKLFFDESNKDLGFKDFNEFNTILGFDSQEVKEQAKQPAVPTFMDVAGQTQQTIQTAQQKVTKQQPIVQPPMKSSVKEAMGQYGLRSDLTPNQQQQKYRS